MFLKSIIRTSTQTLAAMSAGALLVLASTSATSAPKDPDNYRPCPTEDSVSCVWDAKHMGNGRGYSFYVAYNGVQYRLPHNVAHDLID